MQDLHEAAPTWHSVHFTKVILQMNKQINETIMLNKQKAQHEIIATIHHLNVNLYDPNSLILLGKAKALIDTGCSMTSISEQFFHKINVNKQLEIFTPSKEIITQTCDGSENGITCITQITVAFNISQENNSFGVKLDMLVIPKLNDNMILGLDFLASKFIDKLTADYIHYNYGGQKISEPFIKQVLPIEINNFNKEMILAPNNQIVVKLPINKSTPITRISSNVNYLSVTNSLLAKKFVKVTLTNDSNNNLIIPLHRNLVSIKHMKTRIPNEEYMDDKEQAQADKNYYTSGSFQPSVTSFIESKNRVSEFKLENPVKHLTDKELLEQFELQHLPPKALRQIKRIIIECRPAFSLHKYDIGKQMFSKWTLILLMKTLQRFKNINHYQLIHMKRLERYYHRWNKLA